MAQLATTLSHTGLLAQAKGGPRYMTTVFDGATGLEKRTIVWSTPRHVWAVTLKGKLSEFAALQALHVEAKGQAYSFLWTPPGYSEGDFRFGEDSLEFVLQAASTTDDPIATVSLTLLEVLGE